MIQIKNINKAHLDRVTIALCTAFKNAIEAFEHVDELNKSLEILRKFSPGADKGLKKIIKEYYDSQKGKK